ncbi:MAG: radical SAM protein [Myxococcota bacterium]
MLRSRPSPDPMREPPRLPPVRPGAPMSNTALLINPFYPKDPHASYGKHVLTPSLTLTSLAGATPKNWTVTFWDENLLQGPPPLDVIPQVVGITVHLTFAERAYALARWLRAHGCVVIMGGLHALSCPDEVAPHADAIAIGDGTVTWPAILRDVDRGELKPRYRAPMNTYKQSPTPDRSVLPEWGFLTPLSLIATVGCHNRCDFCYLSTGDERIPYQTRKIGSVVQEFEQSGQPYAVFIDNNLGSNKGYLRRLCRALRPLERIWSAAVTLDVTDDPALVREMALAGCTGVFIGFESLTDGNLADAGKRFTPKARDFADRIQLLHDHGIQVNGSFVVGFDHDGPDCFERLGDWVEANRMECATYHILTPYPGTPLFARMKAEGRILHEDWSKYDTAHCVFRPKRMTPAQLEAGYEALYARTFSMRSIWARRPQQPAAVPAYLGMALLYKRSNVMWKKIIENRMTHQVWAPLVELTRKRHLRFRQRLAAGETPERRQWFGPRVFRPGV